MAKRSDKFDVEEFRSFLKSLQVDSKEEGIIALGDDLLGTQEYFIEEVAAGLAAGIHYFVILKGRQLGITTIVLALDLYWHFKHEGMQGTLATDNEENREVFRTTLTNYVDGLPAKWKQPVKSHNRTQLALGNRSRMVYQVAGTKKKGQGGGMGRGKAITMMHATEVSSWGDQEGLASLEASLAQINPLRLYIFESTARGYNMFFDMWETALIAETQKAIFIGWWRTKYYSVPAESQIYQVYWDGTLTTEETRWVAQVKELYDYEISTEQIAWWRWQLNETMKGDEQMMFQEYPPTEDYAFVMTGSQFFSSQRLTDQMKIVEQKPFDVRRFVFGAAFEDTILAECSEKTATLKIWELPVMRGQYVIGGDPAWGSSEWADRFAINVSRCYADGIEQVAEFCTPEMNTMQFAWVMLYLAGAYGDPTLQSNILMNLEINGPGQAVWSEIQTLKMRASMMKDQSNLARLLLNIQNFLYRRPDSINGITGYHTKTTAGEKERMFNLVKDHHEFGTLIINSKECLNEMKNVVREDGQIGAPGRGKDDRVVAQGLSMLAWSDMIRVRLIQSGMTRSKSKAREQMPIYEQKGERTIENYLQNIGLKPKITEGVRR